MLGGPERVYKNIKDLYGLTYNPDLFNYFRIEPNFPLVQDGDKKKHGVKDEDIQEIHFLFIPTGKVLRIPYQNRMDYQKFLNTGDKNDFPKKMIG